MKPLDAEPALRRYETLLAGPGIERGLLGPREIPRLWDRHILNCAVVAEEDRLIPQDSSVIDVGSGAGLPGLVWALVRPDLEITLVESLLRRTTFLQEAVQELSLSDRVHVLRARAEDLRGVQADVVTARAVAPLPKLLRWLTPLTRPSGRLVLLKGASAGEEMTAAAADARRLGLQRQELLEVGIDRVEPPTTVVMYQRS